LFRSAHKIEEVFQDDETENADHVNHSNNFLDNSAAVANSCSSRYLPKKVEVLAFITLWNLISYNLTLDFGFKFSIVVPVWLQLINQGGFKIGGEQDILPDWLDQMRASYPTTQILPRVNFEFRSRIL
jgi:hypothetical protein